MTSCAWRSQSWSKAVPRRPIFGIEESLIETTENGLKSLLAEIHPRIDYRLATGHVDGRSFIVVAVEPGSAGPYETSEKAQRDKSIGLRAGRYIRVGRETRLPNRREEFELLKKYSGFCFSSELNVTATLDDLSYEYMREYLAQTGAKDDREVDRVREGGWRAQGSRLRPGQPGPLLRPRHERRGQRALGRCPEGVQEPHNHGTWFRGPLRPVGGDVPHAYMLDEVVTGVTGFSIARDDWAL